jgi:hypothetical protein
MRPEADAARAEVMALLLALQAEVAEQAGEQGLVDLLVGGRLPVLAPAVLAAQRVQLRMHLAPLAHAQVAEVILAAPVALLALRGVRPLRVEGLPQVQPGEELRALLLFVAAPFGVGLVRRAGLLLRPLARILHRQGCGDDQHLAQAVAVARGEDHAADARIERQLRQLAAGFGEFSLVVHRTQLGEQLIAVGDHARQRPVDEGEFLHFAQVQRLHAQDNAGQRGAQDLRVGVGGAFREVVLAIEADADAAHDAAAAPRPLVGGGAGDVLDLQHLHLVAMGVALDAREARIDDVADARHGKRGLGDVGGEHDAAAPRGCEHPLLLLRRLARVERQQFRAGRVVFPQRLGRLADLALTGQEHQHVTRAVAMAFVDGVDDGVRDVDVVGRRPPAHLDGIEPAGHLDHGGIVEVFRKALGIQRRRGDDHLQVRPLIQELFQIAEQEVDIEAALVRLVDDQRVVLPQLRVALRLGEQDAVGHQLDVAVGADAVGEADLEADGAAQFALQLLGDARGGGAGGDAARLGVADQPVGAAAQFQADLRQLRRLARAGLAADDDHLVLRDGLGDLAALRADRQLVVIGNRRPRGQARCRIENAPIPPPLSRGKG